MPLGKLASSGKRNAIAQSRCGTALLLIDLLSDFRFPDGAKVLKAALPVARRIVRLRHRAKAAGMPVIYVNDNLGEWRADREKLLRKCLAAGSAVSALIRLVEPEPDDYFIFKHKHSGFFGTPLESLLKSSRIHRLILTGATSHQCVLFTATDAYVREFELVIPRDCIASPSPVETQHALFIFRTALRAATPLSPSIRFS